MQSAQPTPVDVFLRTHPDRGGLRVHAGIPRQAKPLFTVIHLMMDGLDSISESFFICKFSHCYNLFSPV